MYLDLIVGVGGFAVGLLISHLAKEELAAGEKYFLFAKNILLGIIELMILLFFIQQQLWPGLIILVIISLAMLVVELKFKKNILTLFLPYPLVIMAYFLLPMPVWLMMLVFLYGLPAAALFYHSLKN